MIKKFDNKILLVDDDTKNLQVAMNILKNYNVIYAQSGEKALELIEKNNFDLILLDIVMPIINGYEVCKIIKNNSKTKRIPIIFLTVKDEEKDIVKGFDLGAVDYVTKPFYSEVLLKRVEVHLKLASVMNELKQINSNLNNIVDNQVKEIREKDKIIFQQSKISAMADIIEVISLQWKIPLDKIKLYLQSLSLKISNIEEFKSDKIFKSTLNEVSRLDEIMSDFHKFFNNQQNKELVNIKVSIDNAIFPLKERLNEQEINVTINGDILLSINIVFDEIKHIFSKLLNKSIENFKDNKTKDDKFIHITMEDNNDSIFITYEDNAKIYDNQKINRFFDSPILMDNKSFDLGFYLIKVFIEKNYGLLLIKATDVGIRYIIRFDK